MTDREANGFLSILIVSYNTRDHLRRCLASLRSHAAGVPHEVIVIDNASSDGSAGMIEAEFPEVRLLRSPNNDGYGVAINQGVREARGDWLLFLNPDMEVTSGALETLLDFARSHPRAGVTGPRLIYGDGRAQPSARRFLSPLLLLAESSRLHLLLPSTLRSRLFLGTYFDQDRTMEVPWVSGACHLIPRRVWDEVGPLTEETFCGSDDYDYCYRVRQRGYEVWLCAESTMVHYCSVAVKERWNIWEVEQVAIHNFYVVLESHWPRWRVKTYIATEILSYLLEGARHLVRPRRDQESADDPYLDRLRKRVALDLEFLFDRRRPIRRFQPQQRRQAEQS